MIQSFHTRKNISDIFKASGDMTNSIELLSIDNNHTHPGSQSILMKTVDISAYKKCYKDYLYRKSQIVM